MRKIAIATGTRADWGLLSGIARKLAGREDCHVDILATNMHLSSRYGNTLDEIVADGFADVIKVEMSDATDSPVGTVRAMAQCMEGMSRELERLNPDLIVILGDRFEMLATCRLCISPEERFPKGLLTTVSVTLLQRCRHCILQPLSNIVIE